MAKFPTCEQMAEDVAEKALDELLYDGKTLREWMGIIAEQKPCEDCISRVDAIAALKNLYPDMPIMDIMDARRRWQEKYSQYIKCEKEIERLPSVQPKTGHWIPYIPYDGACPIHFDCNRCGEPASHTSKYCPSCGARMSEV